MADPDSITTIILLTTAIPGVSYLLHAPLIKRGLQDAALMNYLNARDFMNENIGTFKEMEMIGLIRTFEHGPVMHIVCDGRQYFLKTREQESTLMPCLLYDATVYRPTGIIKTE